MISYSEFIDYVVKCVKGDFRDDKMGIQTTHFFRRSKWQVNLEVKGLDAPRQALDSRGKRKPILLYVDSFIVYTPGPARYHFYMPLQRAL